MPSTTFETEKPLHPTSENIVSVLVGPEAKWYAIDKDLLCSRSGYFKAALTGNFREAEDLVVTFRRRILGLATLLRRRTFGR